MTNDPTPRLSPADSAELATCVAEMAKAGLPLPEGLRAAAAEAGSGRLSRALRRVADALAAGTPLDEVVQSPQLRLPAHLRVLLVAAVRSGQFARVLDELLQMRRARRDVLRRVALSLAYPGLLLGILLAITVYIQCAVTPMIAEVFREFGTELPQMTRVALSLQGATTLAVVAGILLIVALPLLASLVPGWVYGPRALYAMPLIGPLWRWHNQAHFCRLMAVMLDQRVALPDALRLTAVALHDADLAAACRRVAAQVEVGDVLYEQIATRPQFARTLAPLVEWGQRTPALVEAFRAAAEMFDARTQTQCRGLEAMLLPLMFLIVSTVVGFFVLAFFLPLVALIQKLT